MTAGAATFCPRCSTSMQERLFCPRCGVFTADETATVQRVTYTRRILSWFVEILLLMATIVVGWFVWFGFTERTAQTPAKRLMNVYVLDTRTLKAKLPGETWGREFVKYLITWPLSTLHALWILVDKDRQAIHDKLTHSILVYAPSGLPAALQAPVAEAGVIPLRLEIDYPARMSRLLVLVKWLLMIPHAFVVWVYAFQSLFTILPALFGGMNKQTADRALGFARYNVWLAAYGFLLCDAYPPFSTDQDESYPVRLYVDYPDSLVARDVRIRGRSNTTVLEAFVIFIPYSLAVSLTTILVIFAVFLLGRLPRPLFEFHANYMRRLYQGKWVVKEVVGALPA